VQTAHAHHTADRIIATCLGYTDVPAIHDFVSYAYIFLLSCVTIVCDHIVLTQSAGKEVMQVYNR